VGKKKRLATSPWVVIVYQNLLSYCCRGKHIAEHEKEDHT
jgi:hypothetical protein